MTSCRLWDWVNPPHIVPHFLCSSGHLAGDIRGVRLTATQQTLVLSCSQPSCCPVVTDDTNDGATQCQALYDYAGQQEDELTFSVSLGALACAALPLAPAGCSHCAPP